MECLPEKLRGRKYFQLESTNEGKAPDK